jgi:hypothetical protein
MHPLTNNLTQLTDDELHKKYAELQKRFMQAYRFGPQAIIPQLQMVMEDYQAEIQTRNRKQMDDLLKRSESDGKGFKGIIDIQ